MQELVEDKVQYVSFHDLQNPSLNQILLDSLQNSFNSKQWKKQFQTLILLRQANKYHPKLFLQLLPNLYTLIVAQVDNLRSNNSKEALTLVGQFIEHQDIKQVDKQVITALVNCLMIKSVCEKAFLKNEALKAINSLANKSNKFIVSILNNHTESQNGTISQLAIKTLQLYLDNNKVTDIDQDFLRILSHNINGKRAVVQKKAKQILDSLKTRLGQQKLQNLINNSTLTKEQSQYLILQIKKPVPKKQPQQSLKDFIKAKKVQKVQQ